MSSLGRIFIYVKPYWKRALAAILLLVGSIIADLAVPGLVRNIIDNGIIPRNLGVVFHTAVIMVGLAAVETVFAIGNTLFAVHAAQSFAADIRSRIFHKIQSFSFGNLDQFQTGQLMVRLTSDVNQIQMVVMMSLRILIRAPLLIADSVILMWMMNPELARITLLLMPLTLILSILFIFKAQPPQQKRRLRYLTRNCRG